jgi:hypothetical protein
MGRGTIAFCTFLACCASFAAAQTPPPDTLKVDYFSNSNNAIDETVRLTNPGTSGTSLCAAVYVFAADQEMSECCSCLLTPDGLRTLSVNVDLIANPLRGVIIPTGSIKIVSITTKGGLCPTYPTRLAPMAGIRAWATHLQNGNILTETASQDATLSTNEVSRLQRECYAIRLVGSGNGLCTCGTGD